jgi:dTMP kinase
MIIKKSFFITFEGLEGSGKSTQLALLSSKLKEKGYDVVATREPGGTRIGEKIRTITHDRENVDLTRIAEAYLMAGARAQHVREIIRPALEGKKIVLCDRYIDSTVAYQGFGREIGEDKILELNKLAIDMIYPDLTILLDCGPIVALTRRRESEKVDRLDLQQPDFYERVHMGYHELYKKHPDRIIAIDSSRSIEEVAKDVWVVVEEKLVPLLGTKLDEKLDTE